MLLGLVSDGIPIFVKYNPVAMLRVMTGRTADINILGIDLLTHQTHGDHHLKPA